MARTNAGTRDPVDALAASFNGSSQWLSVTDNAALSMGAIPFTVLGWWNTTTLAAAQAIVAKYEPTGNQREYLLSMESNTHPRFWISSNGTTTFNVQSASTPAANTWHLSIGWFDPVAQTVNISVDGAAGESAGGGTVCFDGSANFNIGAFGNAGTSNPFSGLIGPCAVWKRLLSSAERTALWNGGSGYRLQEWTALRAQIVGGWPLNELSGARRDLFGTNTLSDNGTTLYNTGPF